MKIIVTGGAGYIGSHTLKILNNNGHETLTIDNLSTGHKKFVKWGEFEKADICELDKLKIIFRKFKADAVIHFAASSIVSESFNDPIKILKNNIYGSLNVLEAMKASKINNIVFSSTCSIYGLPKSNPINEDMTKNPISPYGESKLIVENFLNWFDKAGLIKYISLRYFNAAGADPDGELGEEHIPETHLIPSILDTALGFRPFFEIYGTKFSTHDGTCIRDYIHVTDIARAHVLALEKLLNGTTSTCLNLGTGQGYSVMEIINAVKKTLKVEFEVIERKARPGDVAELVANSDKIRKSLNWDSKYSDLDTIVKTAYAWKKINQ